MADAPKETDRNFDLGKFYKRKKAPAVCNPPVFLGALLVTTAIAGVALAARDARDERAAQRQMAALELGLRAAPQGRALAVA